MFVRECGGGRFDTDLVNRLGRECSISSRSPEFIGVQCKANR